MSAGERLAFGDAAQRTLTAGGVDAGILGMRDDEGELSTDMPPFLALLVCVVEVYRDHIIRLAIGVAKGEQEDAPGFLCMCAFVDSQYRATCDAIPSEQSARTICDRRTQTSDL